MFHVQERQLSLSSLLKKKKQKKKKTKKKNPKKNQKKKNKKKKKKKKKTSVMLLGVFLIYFSTQRECMHFQGREVTAKIVLLLQKGPH